MKSATADAQNRIEAASNCAKTLQATSRAAQVAAARRRLLLELGRFLVCMEESLGDLNGVLWQRMGHDNATAERLRRCFDRLGGDYPEWTPDLLAELLRFQQETSASQRAGRLSGSEVDAALDDPRWL